MATRAATDSSYLQLKHGTVTIITCRNALWPYHRSF